MEGGQFGQTHLGAFLVNKSVLLPKGRAIPRERGTSLLYHGTNRTLQLARYLDLINFEKTQSCFRIILCT